MLNMFSIYYKTKLKNKLKNKIQKLVNALSSSLSLRQQLSLAPHISRSSYNNSSSNNALSLFLLIFIQQHSLSLSLPDYSLLVCRLLYSISAAVTTSYRPLLLLRLHHHRCSVSIASTVVALSAASLIVIYFI